MAKKSGKQKTKTQPKTTLPRNILPMGQRVEADKNIYIAQPVYQQIHRFTRNKTENESGGVLVGTVLDAVGKTNILISGFVEAKFCEATPTTLKFTHKTWEHIHREVEKKHPGKKILGWIHTHPDFGIFLSEYDKFIHENFFSQENQIAYVVDPIQGIEGFYFWLDGKLEKCPGFYIYDKTGVKLDVEKQEAAARPRGESPLSVRNVLLGVLTVAVILLTFSNYSLHAQIQDLKETQQVLLEGTNQALGVLQYQINELTAQVDSLHSEETPETPADPTDTTETEGTEP